MIPSGPLSHQPGGHPGAPRRMQVEWRAPQCHKVSVAVAAWGWGERVQLWGVLHRAGPGEAFCLVVTHLTPASNIWETPRDRDLKDKCCN